MPIFYFNLLSVYPHSFPSLFKSEALCKINKLWYHCQEWQGYGAVHKLRNSILSISACLFVFIYSLSLKLIEYKYTVNNFIIEDWLLGPLRHDYSSVISLPVYTDIVCTHIFCTKFCLSSLFLPSHLYCCYPSLHQNSSPKWLTPSFLNKHLWRHPGIAKMLCLL